MHKRCSEFCYKIASILVRYTTRLQEGVDDQSCLVSTIFLSFARSSGIQNVRPFES